ncbi:hypothetical protein OG785_41005 [Streptomyces sp. NBC_00006]|uniref:hypothetical protein n=1 Tax=Streptomyces sp. NBC_00006 TaxID=2975619 RepID=UPI002251BEAE|nr:hypothetical protein [Streptomyces sp. NBC_00006]MCX5536929.1 hypothetical protein [Streptomyces sp. NBC_00006]
MRLRDARSGRFHTGDTATALLLAFDGNPIGVGLYSAAAALVLALCAWGLRETFRVPTAELGEPQGEQVN